MHRIVQNHRHIIIAAGIALVPIAAFATMTTASQARSGVACDIRTNQSSGQVTLNAVASTNRNVNGTYTFHVSSAGSSNGTNIDQSGSFAATPSKPATLGSVMLSTKGAVYDATLDITVDQHRISCSERIGDGV